MLSLNNVQMLNLNCQAIRISWGLFFAMIADVRYFVVLVLCDRSVPNEADGGRTCPKAGKKLRLYSRLRHIANPMLPAALLLV